MAEDLLNVATSYHLTQQKRMDFWISSIHNENCSYCTFNIVKNSAQYKNLNTASNWLLQDLCTVCVDVSSEYTYVNNQFWYLYFLTFNGILILSSRVIWRNKAYVGLNFLSKLPAVILVYASFKYIFFSLMGTVPSESTGSS